MIASAPTGGFQFHHPSGGYLLFDRSIKRRAQSGKTPRRRDCAVGKLPVRATYGPRDRLVHQHPAQIIAPAPSMPSSPSLTQLAATSGSPDPCSPPNQAFDALDAKITDFPLAPSAIPCTKLANCLGRASILLGANHVAARVSNGRRRDSG